MGIIGLSCLSKCRYLGLGCRGMEGEREVWGKVRLGVRLNI